MSNFPNTWFFNFLVYFYWSCVEFLQAISISLNSFNIAKCFLLITISHIQFIQLSTLKITTVRHNNIFTVGWYNYVIELLLCQQLYQQDFFLNNNQIDYCFQNYILNDLRCNDILYFLSCYFVLQVTSFVILQISPFRYIYFPYRIYLLKNIYQKLLKIFISRVYIIPLINMCVSFFYVSPQLQQNQFH
eukprot:TRINITY_DN935_c0_g1_i9.p2 TRINITY_DN935_c0_g1~~TRINITY_DN935_c0_g1_i9.p2  ORF type:complete len:189 (-),score=-15.28 TRINITY_DN935_c0_g1_i9:638-1204(-)